MARSSRLPRPLDRPTRAALRVATVVRAVAFWTGVLLPLAHVPLLLLVDQGRVDGLPLVARLLVANAVAVVVGHGHDPSGPGPGWFAR